MYKQRFRQLNTLLSDDPWGALVLLPGSTLQYLTGLSFHLMERPTLLLVAPGQKPILIVPELERAKAEASNLEVELFTYGEDSISRLEVFSQAIARIGDSSKRIGVDPLNMRFHELSLLQSIASEWTFASASDLLEKVRIHKSEAEVEFMRQAAAIAEKAMLETVPQIRIGMTERELASELVLQTLRAGSEPNLPFEPIVASGPNSALPHASPSSRKLESGDLLIIDWGARVGGYISDLTRTFAIEKLDPELETIHLIVQQANDAARDAVRPGATCGSIDQEARKVIDTAGYGKYFIHRTGHGIGLETHEAPYIVADNPTRLAPGMTFTIEPGIYLPGRGGVRIEDDMVVTETGGESLSQSDRALEIIGA
ncbi:MAG: aminopeptidase P family protein [Anaerolineales bacterium]|nr:MAG: aminopeptidase P family protein [Anaerolineales bacterium]